MIRDIPGLTGLRGYAALMVCLHHYMYRQSGTWIADISQKGDWGVIVFFVLSGFIMSYVYQDWFIDNLKTGEYTRFLRLRIARIYPLHILCLILWASLELVGRIQPDFNDTFSTFILNVFLLHAWGFTSTISWNQPSWSISSEFFCYLIFPFFIITLRNLGFVKLFLLMILIVSEPLFNSYAYLLIWMFHKLSISFELKQFDYAISLIDWFSTFAYGAFSYYLMMRIKFRKPINEILFIFGLTVLIVAGCENITDSGVIRTIVTISSSFMIFGIFQSSVLGGYIFGNALAVYLGNISYALYLSHILVRQLISHSWSLSLQLAVALLVATLLHYYFERPCRSLFRKRFSRHSV